jgi:hypothetical protein
MLSVETKHSRLSLPNELLYATAAFADNATKLDLVFANNVRTKRRGTEAHTDASSDLRLAS